MRVYEAGYVKYHESVNMLCDYLSERFSQGRYVMKNKQDFINNWKKKYVLKI